MSYSLAVGDGVRSWLTGELEDLIHFRTTKAEEHPEDDRNQKAIELAKPLLRLAAEAPEQPCEAMLAKQLDQWFEFSGKSELVPDPLDNEMSAYWRDVGFLSLPTTIEERCSDLSGPVAAKIEIHSANLTSCRNLYTKPRTAQRPLGSLFEVCNPSNSQEAMHQPVTSPSLIRLLL